MDNSVKRIMAWWPLEPYGFYVTYIDEGEELPDEATLVEPPMIPHPRFDFDNQQWETAPEPPVTPSEMQQIVMQQAMTITQMQQTLMQQSKDIATLKGVNK